jgi:N-terminal domain of (some) glycogen debranching enzymes
VGDQASSFCPGSDRSPQRERIAMPFMVQIGPPQISIHQGQIVLISDPDGQINWPSERGLYFLDTRVVSSWTVYANGEPWELLNSGPITYYAARIFLTNRSLATESGIIPPRTLGFTIGRWIYGGMHEDLDITNNSMKPIKFQLEIAIRCDFADLFAVKAGNIVRRGRITTEWSQAHQQLCTVYCNRDFSRRLQFPRADFRKKPFMQTVVSASRSHSNLE